MTARSVCLVLVLFLLWGCRTFSCPPQSYNCSGSLSHDSFSDKPTITNLISDCVDTRAEIMAASAGTVMLDLTLTTKKSTGGCGCRSAIIRYRVFGTTPSGEDQLLTGQYNSLKLPVTAKRFSLKLPSDMAPFRIQVSCGGD